jgi:hypothetical protein
LTIGRPLLCTSLSVRAAALPMTRANILLAVEGTPPLAGAPRKERREK